MCIKKTKEVETDDMQIRPGVLGGYRIAEGRGCKSSCFKLVAISSVIATVVLATVGTFCIINGRSR